MNTIDLHGLSLREAKAEIRNAIMHRKLVTNQQSRLFTIVHGYNHGTKIRDYVRSGEMECDLISQGVVNRLRGLGTKRPGATTFEIIPPTLEEAISAFNSQNGFNWMVSTC